MSEIDTTDFDKPCPYTVKRTLGGGSYGCVFLVEHTDPAQMYAMKRIYMNTSQTEAQLRRQLHELNILSFNRCDYLLQSKDVVLRREGTSDPNILEIVSDAYMEGNLDNFIYSHNKSGEALSQDTIWFIFLQLCMGVLYLHNSRIIHRDLKPSNILLRKSTKQDKHKKTPQDAYDVVICDFGSSICLTKDLKYCHTKIGTPYFMSPEQYNSNRYDYKTDVWSLGCVLYELITLEKPFTAPNIVMLNYKISRAQYRPLPLRNQSDANAVWSDLLKRMLEKDTAHRIDIHGLLRLPVVQERMKRYGLSMSEGVLTVPESVDVRVGDTLDTPTFTEHVLYIQSLLRTRVTVRPSRSHRLRALDLLNAKLTSLRSKLEGFGLKLRPYSACAIVKDTRCIEMVTPVPIPQPRPQSEYVRTRHHPSKQNPPKPLKALKPIPLASRHTPYLVKPSNPNPINHVPLHPLPPVHKKHPVIVSPYLAPLHPHAHTPSKFVERLRANMKK